MKQRRRNYLINKRYQLRFIAAFLALSVSGIGAATGLVYHFVKTGIEENLYRSHLKISNINQIALPVTVKIDLLFLAAGAVSLVLLSVYYYRKTRRLERSMMEGLENLKNGRLDFRFEIGQKKEFPGLEGYLNRMIESLREKAAGDRKLIQEIEKSLEGTEINFNKIRQAAEKLGD